MAKEYKKTLGIIRNRAIRKELASLDPIKDNCRIVYLLTCYEFYMDIKRSLEIALFRTFASPKVSSLLHRTGEFRKRGQKRYDDTALLIFAFMQVGYDSPEGKFAIEHMNKIHAHYKIDNEDYLYVLSTFILCPLDWIAKYGWRKLGENEQNGFFQFFRQVGIRMHLTDIPETLADFRVFAKDYEDKYFKLEDSNVQVGEATINIVKGWVPGFVHGMVKPAMVHFMDKPLRDALGYKKTNFLFSGWIEFVFWIRKQGLKIFHIGKHPVTLKNVYSRSYSPNPIVLEELGPPALIGKKEKGQP